MNSLAKLVSVGAAAELLAMTIPHGAFDALLSGSSAAPRSIKTYPVAMSYPSVMVMALAAKLGAPSPLLMTRDTVRSP